MFSLILKILLILSKFLHYASAAQRIPAKAMRNWRRKKLRKEMRKVEACVAHEPPFKTLWSPSNHVSEYSG
jgi:hypothetical protein